MILHKYCKDTAPLYDTQSLYSQLIKASLIQGLSVEES